MGFFVVACTVKEHRKGPYVVGSEDDVDPWRAFDDGVAVFLCEAAADGDLQVRVFVFSCFEHAEVTVKLIVCVFTDRARVEYDDVGFAFLGVSVDWDHACGFEQAGDPFGVVDVHLAAERVDLVGARGRLHTGGLGFGCWV